MVYGKMLILGEISYGKNHETNGNGWESLLSKEWVINAKNPHINVYFINIKQVEQYVYHMKTINNHNKYIKNKLLMNKQKFL